MFPAPSKSFDRRPARAGSEQRRSLPANRIAKRHEAPIRIDIAALAVADPGSEAGGANGLSIGLPESAFRTSDGEQVRFIELPVDNEVADDGALEAGLDASAALATRNAKQAGGRTKLALLASVALHLLAAASLLTWMQDDRSRIAGGTPNEIAGLGNAAADQVASGDAVNVTITTIPIVKAHPVKAETLPEKVETERLAATETISEEASVERVTEASSLERSSHVKASEPAPETPPVAEPDAPAQAIASETSTAATEPEAAMTASDTPDILAAPTPSDSAEAVPAQQPRAAAVSSAEPVEETRPEETVPADDAPLLAEQAPLPTPRPEKTAAPAEKRKVEAERKKPVRTAARYSTPGSGGRDSADARRGVTEGRNDGRSASTNDSRRTAISAGNAAVSNYPGKVVAKLRRALRYPSEARGRRLKGTAQVQFVVARSGSVGAVRLAGSSGSPILDDAALATVRRAAPFPPIPEGAGRSSWAFTVPLAFVR